MPGQARVPNDFLQHEADMRTLRRLHSPRGRSPSLVAAGGSSGATAGLSSSAASRVDQRTRRTRPLTALRLLLWLTPLVALGCRTDPNQILLEQEARMLEDRVYQLQGCLADCQAAREAAIRENESLKKQLDGDRGSGGDDRGPASTRRRAARRRAIRRRVRVVRLRRSSRCRRSNCPRGAKRRRWRSSRASRHPRSSKVSRRS